jgi:hypothetical protein
VHHARTKYCQTPTPSSTTSNNNGSNQRANLNAKRPADP